MNYKELNLRAPDILLRQVKINDATELGVRTYLPIAEKADLIAWTINMAIDDNTGCISPIRLETFFTIAVLMHYAGIEIDEDLSLPEVYDVCEQTGVTDSIMNAIPADELQFLQENLQDTVEDMVRYNNSFAGIMNAMKDNAGEMDTILGDTLDKVKNAEGLELLSEIRNVVGTD